MSLKFNPITSEFDLVNAAYDPTTDTIHLLKTGDTMSGALINTLASGNSLVWDTTTLIVDSTNHRVGIGTASPIGTLHVAGNSNLTNERASSGANQGAGWEFRRSRGTLVIPAAVVDGDWIAKLLFSSYDGNSIPTSAQIIAIINGTVATGSVPTDLVFMTGSSSGGVERLRIASSGNVGIGTTAPGGQLQVNASSSSTIGIIIKGAASQSADLTQWQNSSGTILASVAASGVVSVVPLGATPFSGIPLSIINNTSAGTTPPAGTILHLVGSAALTARVQLDGYGGIPNFTTRSANGTAASPTATTLDQALFQFGSRGYGATGFSSSSRISVVFGSAEAWTDTAQGTYIQFLTTKIGTAVQLEKMRLTDAGQLGIGTTAPGAMLQVKTSAAGVVGKIIKGFASQTADLLQLQDSTGTVLGAMDKGGHYLGGGTAPAIAAGTGAGTGPTVSLTGHDQAGQISVTTGTLPTLSADVFTVTFNTGYASAPYVNFSPANAVTALLSGASMVYVTATTTTFKFTAGTTPLTAATTYLWNYSVIG